jgi:hypothetical protein
MEFVMILLQGSGVDGNVSGSSSFLILSFVQDKEIGDGDKNSYGLIVLPIGLLGLIQ